LSFPVSDFVGQPVPKLDALGTYATGGQGINDKNADNCCPQGQHQLPLHLFILVPLTREREFQTLLALLLADFIRLRQIINRPLGEVTGSFGVEGVDHNDLALLNGRELIDAIVDLVALIDGSP
jgi:hypothetical protein